MRTRIPLLVPVIATFLAAGCLVGPPGPRSAQPDPESTQATPDPSEPTQEPKPTRSDEPTPATVTPSGPAPAKPGPVLEKVSRPISVEGRTPLGACKGNTPKGCASIKPGENTSIPLEDLARPVLVEGNLTWNASTHSTGHLTVVLLRHNGIEYVPRNGDWGRIHGPSPLHVAIKLDRYAGEQLALGIFNDECLLDTGPVANCAFAGSGGAFVSLEQAFAFNGRLTGWN